MSLLAPAALALLGLALPILLLYMLKLKRREVEISSTFLWQMLLRDRQANAPWQRIKRNLLLFLQLLILLALVVALARPAFPTRSLVSGSAVLILDASASMNAQELGQDQTRFERAKSIARQAIENLPPEAQVSILLVGHEPAWLGQGQGNRVELLQALEQAQPEQGEVDWPAALALAAGAASAGGDRSTTLILSDGGLPQSGLPALPGEVQYIPVGTPAPNLAVTALALRPTLSGAQLFARVSNYSANPQEVILSLYQSGDLFDARRLRLEAESQQEVILEGLSIEGGEYEARLSPIETGAGPLDALAVDDAAYAVYAKEGPHSILLAPSQLSPQPRHNLFLQQALRALFPGGKLDLLQTENAGAPTLPSQPYDLWVFDGWLPAELPQGNLLLLRPGSNALFSTTGIFTATAPAEVRTHPLTEFVDWSNVHIRQAQQIQLPDWATELIHAPGGPLVFVGENEGRRIAVLTFDLHESDLPLQVAFPILLSNLSNYLIQVQPVRLEDPFLSLRPGDAIRLNPGFPAEQLQIVDPLGQTALLRPQADSWLFTQARTPGFYRIRVPGIEQEQTFAINLFSAQESNLKPAAAIQIGLQSLSPSQQEAIGQREIWSWLAALALAVLLLEWWLYHRSQNIPPIHHLRSLLQSIKKRFTIQTNLRRSS